jgi:hypothetical protein
MTIGIGHLAAAACPSLSERVPIAIASDDHARLRCGDTRGVAQSSHLDRG